jgi:hypothetical protein
MVFMDCRKQGATEGWMWGSFIHTEAYGEYYLRALHYAGHQQDRVAAT